MLVVDYLQLMTNPDLEGEARHLEVASISRALVATKKELNVPIVALAQLNRETERNRNHKPGLADLRESGQIEQDADTVGLLYRPGLTDEQEDEVERTGVQPVNLLVAKQRNGPTGDCEFLFHREFMRFVDKYAGKGAKEGELKAREEVTAED